MYKRKLVRCDRLILKRGQGQRKVEREGYSDILDGKRVVERVWSSGFVI